MHRLRSALAIAVLCGSAARAADAVYAVADTGIAPGAKGARVPIAAMFPLPTQGFSMALRHDCPACAVRGVTTDGTIASEADFVEILVDAQLRTVVVGLLMAAAPPGGLKAIPALPEPAPVVALEVDVDAAAALGEFEFRFEPAGLPSGGAWVYNTYAADNRSFPVTQLRPGVVTVAEAPPPGFPRFIRGDANQNLELDLSDVIYMLNARWMRPGRPPCLDACDVNDDGKLDVADPIYLLSYLFGKGPRPPVPGLVPGIDWTPDSLDCEHPAAGWLTDFWPR
ncbi:MAG TPA: hypothetical protein PKX48_02890 [Planctomycetota bacterium]|nr:hypothetical protein [Planctomycetota bacterium]OQC20737.1 MAG: hypothetical protein BWX69_01576 [Planctomycetes bacterium ADurb.Bin069]NMD34842.1 hypothetical protein [Planctomycetota bacterium]HNR98348.1 hypothetical protein [Planctomycetota bacterium]HNU24666.1 hypothetical protein [Planctomycetota bacterium]